MGYRRLRALGMSALLMMVVGVVGASDAYATSPGSNTQWPATLVGVYRPSSNGTFILNIDSADNSVWTRVQLGASGDLPVTGDWNGDYTSNVGVYRPSTNQFILNTDGVSNDVWKRITLGASGDLPVTGDWDNNGTTDVGVYRPSTNTFILNTDGVDNDVWKRITLGTSGDLPITGDWDGNGTTDVGVYRPSTNQFILNTDGVSNDVWKRITLGTSSDLPVTGDWDGNGTTDVGVYRPSTNQFILNTDGVNNDVSQRITLGTAGDLPVAGAWVTAKTFAQAYEASQYGWGSDQYSCLDSLWTQESSWNKYAANPSGAYGIPQALPASKMSTAGPDWQTNPFTQVRWGLSYISTTYGTPCDAWNHELQFHWY